MPKIHTIERLDVTPIAELEMQTTKNLLAWEVLATTCRTRSISQTAQLLDLDLPKASRLLSSLEKEVGEPLFNKSCRPITPTPRAMELCAAVDPLLVGLKAALEPRPKDQKFSIRFAAPIELSQEYFSDRLYRYAESNPGVEFAIEPQVRVEEILSGAVDVAILNQRPVNATGLVIRHYSNATTIPMATPEYLRRRGVPKCPADLKDHDGLLLKACVDDVTRNLYRADGIASDTLSWRNTFVTHDQLTLKRHLLEHHGITVDLSTVHASEELRTGKIVPILKGWKRRPWYMCVVNRREDEVNSPQLRNFVRWLAERTREDFQKTGVENRLIVADAYERFEEMLERN